MNTSFAPPVRGSHGGNPRKTPLADFSGFAGSVAHRTKVLSELGRVSCKLSIGACSFCRLHRKGHCAAALPWRTAGQTDDSPCYIGRNGCEAATWVRSLQRRPRTGLYCLHLRKPGLPCPQSQSLRVKDETNRASEIICEEFAGHIYPAGGNQRSYWTVRRTGISKSVCPLNSPA